MAVTQRFNREVNAQELSDPMPHEYASSYDSLPKIQFYCTQKGTHPFLAPPLTSCDPGQVILLSGPQFPYPQKAADSLLPVVGRKTRRVAGQ